ncbi:F-box domain-containing protein [Mycena chlorophos]|uniref:DASH complex subunit DAD1 n=1 Tax=Mycena chlorophos TaxID=658473 RepID=A0A8H6S3L7_MYCCL|nr:F-box domain-containing protein [Mycena chlorophos]
MEDEIRRRYLQQFQYAASSQRAEGHMRDVWVIEHGVPLATAPHLNWRQLLLTATPPSTSTPATPPRPALPQTPAVSNTGLGAMQVDNAPPAPPNTPVSMQKKGKHATDNPTQALGNAMVVDEAETAPQAQTPLSPPIVPATQPPRCADCGDGNPVPDALWGTPRNPPPWPSRRRTGESALTAEGGARAFPTTTPGDIAGEASPSGDSEVSSGTLDSHGTDNVSMNTQDIVEMLESQDMSSTGNQANFATSNEENVFSTSCTKPTKIPARTRFVASLTFLRNDIFVKQRVLDFRRWTTPGTDENWGDVCVHLHPHTSETWLECPPTVDWAEERPNRTPVLAAGAMVRCVVFLTRVDEPVVRVGEKVHLWKVSWKAITAMSPSVQRRLSDKNAELVDRGTAFFDYWRQPLLRWGVYCLNHGCRPLDFLCEHSFLALFGRREDPPSHSPRHAYELASAGMMHNGHILATVAKVSSTQMAEIVIARGLLWTWFSMDVRNIFAASFYDSMSGTVLNALMLRAFETQFGGGGASGGQPVVNTVIDLTGDDVVDGGATQAVPIDDEPAKALLRIRVPIAEPPNRLECNNIPELGYVAQTEPAIQPGAFVRCSLRFMRDDVALSRDEHRVSWRLGRLDFDEGDGFTFMEETASDLEIGCNWGLQEASAHSDTEFLLKHCLIVKLRYIVGEDEWQGYHTIIYVGGTEADGCKLPYDILENIMVADGAALKGAWMTVPWTFATQDGEYWMVITVPDGTPVENYNFLDPNLPEKSDGLFTVGMLVDCVFNLHVVGRRVKRFYRGNYGYAYKWVLEASRLVKYAIFERSIYPPLPPRLLIFREVNGGKAQTCGSWLREEDDGQSVKIMVRVLKGKPIMHAAAGYEASKKSNAAEKRTIPAGSVVQIYAIDGKVRPQSKVSDSPEGWPLVTTAESGTSKKVYMSPIATLPPEIISEMFLHYIPPYPTRPLFHGDCSPTTLGQVCRRWRLVAHSTAVLWRAFHFFEFGPGIDQPTSFNRLQRHLDMAQTWSERSKILPLSVALTTSRISLDAVKAHKLALQFLVANQSRLEYLTVSLFTDIKFDGPMPLLRRLEVGTSPSPKYWYDFKISPAFLAPKLQSFRVDITGVYDRLDRDFPWSQLTHLYLPNVSAIMLDSIFRTSQALRYARIGLATHRLLPPSIASIHLDALEVLVLDESRDTPVGFSHADWDPVHVRVLLAALRVPKLVSLAIRELFLDELKTMAPPFESLGCSNLRRLHVVDSTRVEADYREELPQIEEIVNHHVATRPRPRRLVLGERERLTREIKADFDTVLSSTNTLNRKLEEVIGMTKEYSTIADLWSSFYQLMRDTGTGETDVDQELVAEEQEQAAANPKSSSKNGQ